MENGYTADWPQIATLIKKFNHWACENCGRPHDTKSGYTLTVHHIDANKQNNSCYNLVALCQRCHLKFTRKPSPHQLTFFDHPIWLLRYFDALRLNYKPVPD